MKLFKINILLSLVFLFSVISCSDNLEEDFLTTSLQIESIILKKYDMTIENNTLVFRDIQHFIEVENSINDEEILQLKDETGFQPLILKYILPEGVGTISSLDLPYLKVAYLLNENKIVKIGEEIHEYYRDKVKIIENGDWNLVGTNLVDENIFIANVKTLISRKSTGGPNFELFCNKVISLPGAFLGSAVRVKYVEISYPGNFLRVTCEVEVIRILNNQPVIGSNPKIINAIYRGINSTINYTETDYSTNPFMLRVIYNEYGPSSSLNKISNNSSFSGAILFSGSQIGCTIVPF